MTRFIAALVILAIGALPIYAGICAATAGPAAGPLAGPDDGDNKSEPELRQVAEFSRIDCRILCDLTVKIDKNQTLSVDADIDALRLITTEVHKGTLIIDASEPFEFENEPDIEITVPALAGVVIDGEGDCKVTGLDNASFSVEVNGSADVRLAGRSDRLAINVAGSGDVFTWDLPTQHATVKIVGSGDVPVQATRAVKVEILGSGDVHYRGDATVTQRIIGSGEVRKIER